jgi:hypothetical protein
MRRPLMWFSKATSTRRVMVGLRVRNFLMRWRSQLVWSPWRSQGVMTETKRLWPGRSDSRGIGGW